MSSVTLCAECLDGRLPWLRVLADCGRADGLLLGAGRSASGLQPPGSGLEPGQLEQVPGDEQRPHFLTYWPLAFLGLRLPRALRRLRLALVLALRFGMAALLSEPVGWEGNQSPAGLEGAQASSGEPRDAFWRGDC